MTSKKLIIGILFIALAIILTNCEKMPEKKLATAKSLIIKLEEQQATVHAPEKFEMAMNFYNKANNYIEKKDYKKANSQLDLFINTANSALVKAQNEKELKELAKKDSIAREIVESEPVELDPNYKENSVEENISESKYVAETTHFVETGECLSELSMKYYETSRYWYDIYEANSEILTDPSIIKTGQTLKIPAMEVKMIVKSVAPEKLKDGEYLVKIGENLWSIAEKVFPNESINRWKLLYNFNQEIIVNPNLLRADIIINIPDISDFTYSPGDSIYLVQNGDNLWKIAEILNEIDTSYNFTWQDLFELNKSELEDSSLVYPDQFIKLK